MMVCADHLIFLESRMCSFVMIEVIESTLGNVSLWAAKYELNSTKIELMLFTTKSRAPEFCLPQLVDNVKWLSVTTLNTL